MQGFPPYFVSSFAASLAPQLTQGNIKDMYKYEVIDADQIVPMLEQIGTPKALATQLSELWQASVKLAAPVDQTATQTDAANLKGESKGLIITAYKDSILTNAAATTQLVALGDTTEAASLRLSIADYQITQDNIKQVYATDKDNYLAGNITLEQVLTDLTTAGATVAQQNQYYNALQYAGRSKPKMPTEAELVKWYTAQYINEAQLADAFSLWATQVRGFLISCSRQVCRILISPRSAIMILRYKPPRDMATIIETKLQQAADRARIMREAMEHTTTPPVLALKRKPRGEKAAQSPTATQSPSGTQT